MTILLDGVAELSLGSILVRIGQMVMWLHLATGETEKCRSFFVCFVFFSGMPIYMFS